MPALVAYLPALVLAAGIGQSSGTDPLDRLSFPTGRGSEACDA